jgi:hypothetical protein
VVALLLLMQWHSLNDASYNTIFLAKLPKLLHVCNSSRLSNSDLISSAACLGDQHALLPNIIVS